MTPIVFARVQPLLNEFLVSRCFQDIFEKHGLLDRVAHWSDDELLEAKTLRSWADRFWLDLLIYVARCSQCLRFLPQNLHGLCQNIPTGIPDSWWS